jgi:hypothetical protein
VFDLAMTFALASCLVRSVRARFTVGVVSALGIATLLGVAAVGALRSGLLRGHFGTAMGVFFVGPSGVPHAGLFGDPLLVGALVCAMTAVPAVWAGRAASRRPPGEGAEQWGRAHLAFLAAFTFGAIRLVTALLFRALGGTT